WFKKVSLPAKPAPKHFAIKPPVQPPISSASPPARSRNTGPHHRRVPAMEILQHRIIVILKSFLSVQLGLSGRRAIAMVDGDLFLHLGQHGLGILHPAVMKHPRA